MINYESIDDIKIDHDWLIDNNGDQSIIKGMEYLIKNDKFPLILRKNTLLLCSSYRREKNIPKSWKHRIHFKDLCLLRNLYNLHWCEDWKNKTTTVFFPSWNKLFQCLGELT